MTNHNPVKEALLFFGITIGLSYLVFWGPIAVLGETAISFVSGERGPGWVVALFMIGGFVPSIAAVVLTAAIGGWEALSALLRRAVRFRIGWRNYAAIPIVAFAATLLQIFLNRLFGHAFDFRLFLVQLPSALPLIIIGPLSEELGWRGFALDRLQAKMSPLLASVFVGVVWGFWHLPLFLMHGTSQHVLAIPFVGFVFGTVSVSVLMTLFHNRTGGSVLTAIYFHWVYTYFAQVAASGVTRSPLFNWLEYTPYIAAALAVVAVFGSRLGLATLGERRSQT